MALMRAAATWVVGAAIAVLGVLAVADGIRSGPDASGSPPPVPRTLHGVLVTADASCATSAVRFPSMAAEEPPGPLDCGRVVWSFDGSLMARCVADSTSVTSSAGVRFGPIQGCAPAWRADGALSVVRAGEVVVARRHGSPQVVFSRHELHRALWAGGLQDAGAWTFTHVSWFGLTSFVAVVHGPRSNEAGIAVFAQGGLETFVPSLGGVDDLHASPLGNFAYRLLPEREFVMVSRGGDRITIPPVSGANALTWSPDERYVAIATDEETVVGRVGSSSVVATLPFGANALAWLT